MTIASTHDNYHDAVIAAAGIAASTGRAVGIRKTRPFGRTTYVLQFLPSPQARFGDDFWCEAIEPRDAELAAAAARAAKRS